MDYRVASSQDNTKLYTVSWRNGQFVCTCPHFQYRCRSSKQRCKHIVEAIERGYRKGGEFDMDTVLELIGAQEE